MISLNSVRPFCWFHTYYLITTRFRINNAKISRVIILLSNRTLFALKCPVYKGFQKIFCPFAHPLCIFLANSLVKTSLSGSSGILHYFYFLPFSLSDAYNTGFFSGILLIRFFCNFSLRAAGNSLFTAFYPGVDFFKVSFFSSFRTEKALHQDGL